MTEPTFDRDGYPTEETLQAVRNWNPSDPMGMLEFVRKAWTYEDYFKVKDGKDDLHDTPTKEYHISTAGWSGNESLIYAMQENHIFWVIHWVQSRRGGHYIFEVSQ